MTGPKMRLERSPQPTWSMQNRDSAAHSYCLLLYSHSACLYSSHCYVLFNVFETCDTNTNLHTYLTQRNYLLGLFRPSSDISQMFVNSQTSIIWFSTFHQLHGNTVSSVRTCKHTQLRSKYTRRALTYICVYISRNQNENILHNCFASLSSPFLISATLLKTFFSFLKDSTQRTNRASFNVIE